MAIAATGPAVLLIHAGAFADWFVPLAAEATLNSFRVVRLRRAGYVAGQLPSSHLSITDHARHAATVAAQLGISDAVVVAHSSGELIALELAAARPDLVARLVLLEPAPAGGLAPAAARDGIGEILAAANSPETAYDIFMSVACASDHHDVVASALGPDGLTRAIKESRWFFADEIAAVAEWAFDASDAAAIAQPTTLVVGDASSPMYREVVDRLAAWLTNAHIVNVEGGDHLLPLRDPQRFADIVVDAASVRHAPAT